MLAAPRFLPLLSILLVCFSNTALALVMKGKVYDLKTNQPLPNVNIVNTYTDAGITTDSTGNFTLNVEKGHLVEFRRIGYKIARIRIESEQLPYYNVAMREGAFDLEEVEIRGSNFHTDSLEKRETYKWAIEHYKLEGLDVIQHPFDALSKRNRQIWAFQKRFDYFEKEKYIDFVFNAKLITKVTGIADTTDMELYRRMYRPGYDQLKAWTEYEFLEYIKSTGAIFKRRRQ
ncbi:carboxypeptidase-like regulatory domain-containing protein [Taibaiella koreensis]|uniref:carboxypeptidase-like regulatory domain-containing protein n=1 Tax=Taibaiella koreensis TaxID=1268548 RepID=UPI000E59FDDB|nr:carboxypeptidase-like regulatory domain-containing protein [Taibaiella koreensis]